VDAPLRTLVVAASPAAAGELTRVLMGAGLAVGSRRVADASELGAALDRPAVEWDLVVCAPGGGLDAGPVVDAVRRGDREGPVVVVSAAARSDAARGVIAVAPDRGRHAVALAVRRELVLAGTRRAARQASAALDGSALAAASAATVIADGTREGFPAIYVNPAFERLTGWPARLVLGQSCALLQGPGTDPAAIACLRAALAAGRAVSETLLNYRRDRTPFWNALSLAPVRSAEGRLTHWVGVLSRTRAPAAPKRPVAAARPRQAVRPPHGRPTS
jgi:PAS domain S-box-containing protein